MAKEKTTQATAPAAEESKTAEAVSGTAENVTAPVEAAVADAPAEQPAVESQATAPAAEESDGKTESEAKAETETVSESVKAAPSPVKLGINITNTRMGVKKISLPSGVLTLYPGVITRVQEQDEEAVRLLFKTDTFKRMVDEGAFRFTDYDTAESLLAQATPAPPEDLTGTQPINSLNKDTKILEDLKVIGYHDASATEE